MAGIPAAFIFATELDAEPFEKTAKKFKGKINFMFVNVNDYSQFVANFGLQKDDNIRVAIFKTNENKKYIFPKDRELTEANIEQYFDDFVAGRIKPSFKSEKVTPEEMRTPLVKLNFDHFNEFVEEYDNTLIMFHSLDCVHCKKLKPQYDLVAKKVEKVSNFAVALYDVVANDLPQDVAFAVESFPTVVLSKGYGKEWVHFNGERSEEGLLGFLRQHITSKSELPTVSVTPNAARVDL